MNDSTYNQNTQYTQSSISENDAQQCKEFISSMLTDQAISNLSLDMRAKYLKCFNGPGNSITLDDGRIVYLSAKPPSATPTPVAENFREGFDAEDTVGVKLLVANGSATNTLVNQESHSAEDKIGVQLLVANGNAITQSKPTDNLEKISDKIEKKVFANIQKYEPQFVNDIVSGVKGILSGRQQNNNIATTAANTDSQIYNLPQQAAPRPGPEQPQYQPQYQSSDNINNPEYARPILHNNVNSFNQSTGGLLSVNLPESNNYRDGGLPSFSAGKSEINFPTDKNPADFYSYYGLLGPKGSDYVPTNTISETNKMLGRLQYVPPPLPPAFDFSYFGSLKSQNIDNVRPVNALQGSYTYNEKIVNDDIVDEVKLTNREDYSMIR
jgi:hypothetical protein